MKRKPSAQGKSVVLKVAKETEKAIAISNTAILIQLLQRKETIASWSRKFIAEGYRCSRTTLSLAIHHPPLFLEHRVRLLKAIELL